MTQGTEDGLIDRLKSWWPHDDSPGFTDHPEVDIKAHRSNARLLRWGGVIALLGGFYAGYQAGDPIYVGYGFAALTLATIGELNFRVQAIEWELELERSDADE